MTTNTDEREEIKPVAPTEQTKWRDPSLVGKYMVDPKTGLAGIFRSPDNGETWVLTDTVYGHVYNQDEVDNIWDNGAAHKVADEIKSATADLPNIRKQADEAVKFAESAVAASKVNSDAIVAQSEAISEAKSAMDSATAEIQQTAANAASDAAKIRADVAQVQSEVDTAKAANSASVEALKSDVSAAKQDLADVHDSLTKAQSAIEQNQKLINDNVAQISDDITQDRKDIADVRQGLTKAQADITANQKSINDNVAQINADITQDRKDIASAQQANEDTAKQLDDYSKQAAAQGKTIKSIQDKQDGFTATLADVQGNVAQVSDKVDGLSASLKDTQGNVASVKAQADQLSATLTDHGKAIATLAASAKELSSTLEDADGRLSKVEQTAQTNSSTLSDVQGDLSQVKQNATRLVSTLKDAQGNISTLQQKADSVSTQLASAQGDIATLQTGVDSVKATLTSHDKSIHTLQADSKSLKDSMADAQGDISTLSKTATDVTSELEDHTGRLSKVEQSAAKQATTLSDLQGNLSQVEQKADSNTATISSINKNAMQDRGVITDAKTSFDSLTQLGTYSIKAISLPKMPEQHYGTLVVSGSAGSGWLSQQFVADTTGNVYTRVFSNNAWSAWKQGGSQDAINQVKQTADSNSATIRNVQGDVSTLKQTATGIKSTLASHEGDIHTLQADSKTLKDDMADAKGNISTLQKTATDVTSELQDHAGRISKVEQTASTLTNEFSDQDGRLSKVEQTATGTQQTVANQQGQINNIKTDASGIHETLTGQGNQIANINVTLGGLSTKYEGVSGDLGKLKSSTMQNRGTVSAPDFNSLTAAGFYTITVPSRGKNYPTGSWGTLEVSGQTSDSNGRLNQKYVSDNNAETYVRQYNANTKSWTAWIKAANQNDVTALSNRITTNSTQITQNKQAIALKADQSTVDNLTGEVSQTKAQLKVQADQISSKVSSEDFKTLDNKVGGAIAQIQKNSTAIDQTNQQISLKADQTEVDKVKGTASQNSSRLDVMAGEISSKVTSTDVNNIVDSKGYATTSTVQSLITQKAGSINEQITNLTTEFNARDGINLLTGTKDFNGAWQTYDNGDHWHKENWVDPNGNYSLKSDSMVWNGYYQSKWLDVGTYTFSLFYYLEANYPTNEVLYIFCIPNGGDNLISASPGYLQSLDITPNKWNYAHFTFEVTKAGYSALRIESIQPAVLHISSYKLQRGSIATPWTPAPSDNATVTQVQQITASIDGLQSTVANKADKSQITQLSNMIQSKVSSSDFNDLKDKTTWKSTDSIDLNTAVSQQKIFVKGGSNLPPGSYWWYVQVESGYDSRIVQYAVSDRDNKQYRRQYDGSRWSAWSQGATESEITQLRDDINLRVKSGDLLSQINIQAGQTLIQSKKLYLADDSVIFSNKAFIPSAAIVNLDASKLTFYGAGGTYATMGSGVKQYDQDKLKSTINLQYNGGVEVHASNELGSILTMHDDTIRLAVKSQVYGSGSGQALNQQYSGVWFGSNYTLMNTVDKEGKTTGWAIGSNKSGANNDYRAYLYDNSTSVQPNYGVGIGTTRFDVYAGNSQLFLGPDKGELRGSEHATLHGGTQTYVEGGNEQIYIHDGEVNIGNPNNIGSATGVHLQVFGWATFNGYVEAMGFNTKSTLSSKTRITPLDTADALDKITSTDLTTFQYKTEVAEGFTKRHAGPIIDDVNDVAQYRTPNAFISENRQGRSDADIIGYLMGAVQELTKQLNKLKKEVQING